MLQELFSSVNRKQLLIVALLVFAGICFGGLLASKGLVFTLTLISLPFVIGFAVWIFSSPKNGILVVLYIGFIVNGLGRYVPGPLGLSIDAVMFLTLLATIFKVKRDVLQRLKNSLMLVVGIWFGYTVLQILNPEARSLEAWFYAVRGVSLYMIIYIPLILIWFNEEKDFDRFINIWLIWSIIATLWGFRQIFIGVDSFEKHWLDDGGAVTHLLRGKLRAFSFYSDAGQFGAAMGHIGLAAFILGMGYKEQSKKIYFFIASAICFYGMLLSGTRGALFVPIAGFAIFLLMIGNMRVLIIGFMVGALILIGLKYTSIGQGNDQIRRMRTALDPNDASLLVRLDNQKKIADYLSTRPFGGGIGSAGSWGQRFSPGTFLAETALDSWYVKIWAESGIVGLVLFIGMILYVLIDGFITIRRMPESVTQYKMMALYCGFFGISFASYGNQLFGQSPTSIILYLSMTFLVVGKQFIAPKKLAETAHE